MAKRKQKKQLHAPPASASTQRNDTNDDISSTTSSSCTKHDLQNIRRWIDESLTLESFVNALEAPLPRHDDHDESEKREGRRTPRRRNGPSTAAVRGEEETFSNVYASRSEYELFMEIIMAEHCPTRQGGHLEEDEVDVSWGCRTRTKSRLERPYMFRYVQTVEDTRNNRSPLERLEFFSIGQTKKQDGMSPAQSKPNSHFPAKIHRVTMVVRTPAVKHSHWIY
ncbi:hypothetical protein HJC23_007089 [Cyclotella cryptica]|uniref:Uncharacterized protein n=1 Tax=Cyclotella cryptica TaxID=29204 RepID=A0ABD3NV96_9STRA